MKIFISHQRADGAMATQIANRLRAHGVESYLDVIDPYLHQPGEDLANHIRTEMAKCTQLLAVVSNATKLSQWVPWEIGVATEKEFPLATFADYVSAVPEFLAAWPYLRNMTDVDAYVAASRTASSTYTARKASTLNESIARTARYQTFFTDLRSRLGQTR